MPQVHISQRCQSSGWLHPSHLFAKDGINYAVRYIGCLEVNTSMKVLDFDTRSSIAKECINRVCEAAGLKSVDKGRRTERKIASMLGERPQMDRAGTNVQLTITSLWLKLSDMDSGEAILIHDMPNISFASGGDADTLDFVAYVAKDRKDVRSCFVLECGGGLAQDVITTIGQAFELRFKEFLKHPPTPSKTSPPAPSRGATSITAAAAAGVGGRLPDDVEYYNDLPGKKPPKPQQRLQMPQAETAAATSSRKKDSANSNLIDFHTELPTSATAAAFGIGSQSTGGPKTTQRLNSAAEPEYVNGSVQQRTTGRTPSGGGGSVRDPFDMGPFSTQSPPISPWQSQQEPLRVQLTREEWFHGPISRKDAEGLMTQDGDFLVRESQGSRGQYVLTGMQGGSRKHLLLVDPEGVVRTKDRTFDSVSHLIYYHRDNNLPIISAESALRLKTPVAKQRR